MIGIKEDGTLSQLLKVAYDPKLIELLEWIMLQKGRMVITCGYRAEDPGTHGTIPCRSVDIRSHIYSSPRQVEKLINKYWFYDFNRPKKGCAWLHGEGSDEHLHLQVHSNTRHKP